MKLKRFAAFFLALFLIASAVMLAHISNHNCHHTDCSKCLLIRWLQDNGIGGFAGLLGFFTVLPALLLLKNNRVCCSLCGHTPITLKVKLSS